MFVGQNMCLAARCVFHYPSELINISLQNFSGRYVQVKNDERTKLNELDYDDLVKKENSADPKSLRNSYKRGRGSRDYGRRRRWQKKANGSKSGRVRQNVRSNDKMNQGQRELGQGTQVMGVRGRRTVRKRRAEKSIPDDEFLGLVPGSTQSRDESPKDYIGEWEEDEKIDRFVDIEDEEIFMDDEENEDNVMEDEEIEDHVMENEEHEENVNNIEPMDSDGDAPEVGYEQGSWEFGFEDTSNRWNGDLGIASEEDVDLSEDYNGTEEGGNDDMEELDVDTSEESDCSPNRIGNNGGGESAVSDDYSD